MFIAHEIKNFKQTASFERTVEITNTNLLQFFHISHRHLVLTDMQMMMYIYLYIQLRFPSGAQKHFSEFAIKA